MISAPLVGTTRPDARPATLTFTVQHEGPGSGRVDGTWVGTLNAPATGAILIRVDRPTSYAIAASTLAAPVHATVFVAHHDMTQSFGADVSGSMTKERVAQLAGMVNRGAASGATVEIVLQMNAESHDCQGTIRFVPAVMQDDPKALPSSATQYPPQEFP
jgi:hypothetical protein